MFNWLRVAMPSNRYLVWANKISKVEHRLYPGAIHLEVADLPALLAHVQANPNTTFVWLPLIEDEVYFLLKTQLPANLKMLAPQAVDFEVARNKSSLTRRFMHIR